MAKKQRPTFRCANKDCEETFGYPVKPSQKGVLIVTCPFCQVRSKADLEPYRKRTSTVLRGESDEVVEDSGLFDFPTVVETNPETEDANG